MERHGFLYYVFLADQAEHPMPLEIRDAILAVLRKAWDETWCKIDPETPQ